MPLPLLPFALKGAVIVGKAVLAKGGTAAAAKVAYGAKAAAATYGTAATAAAATTVLAFVGGVAWSVENARRAREAYDLAEAGDLSGAGGKLAAIAVSAKTVGHSDFAGDLQDWMDAGQPLDGRVVTLARGAQRLAEEAAESGKLVED